VNEQPDQPAGAFRVRDLRFPHPRKILPFTAGLLVTMVYAAITYAVFSTGLHGGLPTVMSVAFLFSLPVSIGACAVALAPTPWRSSWWHGLAVAWLSSLLVLMVPLLFRLEALFCIVLAAPPVLLLATFGGAVAIVGFRTVAAAGQGAQRRNALLLVVLLPYVVAPIEAQIAAPDSLHVVHNSVVIEASPEAVWRQIVRVPAIGREEQRYSLLYWIGLPRPVEATLEGDGVGAVRHASFEGGLVFAETVNEWEDRRSIGFSIERDRRSVPPEPLGAIGGPFFDMLDGRYEIEPLAPDRVMLHLSSTHRLSTTFNWYAGLWTEPIMSELQRNILAIVKARSQLPSPVS
jgi:hypothetical protein